MKHKKVNKKTESHNHQYLCYDRQKLMTHITSKDVFNNFAANYVFRNFGSVDVLEFSKLVHNEFNFDFFLVYRTGWLYTLSFDDDKHMIIVHSLEISRDEVISDYNIHVVFFLS